MLVSPVTASSLGRHTGRGLQVWDEESGQLHRELEGFPLAPVWSLATFRSADGRQVRLVAGEVHGELRVYDPEAGSVLHRLRGHTHHIADLACIAASSAAPHHPRLVSASYDGTAKVWDRDTGERLADLRGHFRAVMAVAVWKEHTGGHDRIAIATSGGTNQIHVWDGETFRRLHRLESDAPGQMLPFKSAGGKYLLLVMTGRGGGVQLWDPEEGRLLRDDISEYGSSASRRFHLFESAEGRYLLAISGYGSEHPRHPGDTMRAFLDVWDLGEAPAGTDHLRPAHHLG
jgi:WD40 repeat protein